MNGKKIYLDTNFLIGPIKSILENKDITKESEVVKFLNENKGIESFVSILTVAEMVKILRHDNDFIKYNFSLKQIEGIFNTLHDIMGFKIIDNMKLKDAEGNFIDDTPNGIVITKDVIKYASIHNHDMDCLHLDLAKSNELVFVTFEKKIGTLKELYGNIMTFNKLMKNYRE